LEQEQLNRIAQLQGQIAQLQTTSSAANELKTLGRKVDVLTNATQATLAQSKQTEETIVTVGTTLASSANVVGSELIGRMNNIQTNLQDVKDSVMDFQEYGVRPSATGGVTTTSFPVASSSTPMVTSSTIGTRRIAPPSVLPSVGQQVVGGTRLGVRKTPSPEQDINPFESTEPSSKKQREYEPSTHDPDIRRVCIQDLYSQDAKRKLEYPVLQGRYVNYLQTCAQNLRQPVARGRFAQHALYLGQTDTKNVPETTNLWRLSGPNRLPIGEKKRWLGYPCNDLATYADRCDPDLRGQLLNKQLAENPTRYSKRRETLRKEGKIEAPQRIHTTLSPTQTRMNI